MTLHMRTDAGGQSLPVHGGPDALGAPLHDFSTNSNACGPCPEALHSVQSADASRYPDPAYVALRARLAELHAVAPGRIVLAGSASEFIHRATAVAGPHGAKARTLPAQTYCDYSPAGPAWGRTVVRVLPGAVVPGLADMAGLRWACEPSSPLGVADPSLALWRTPGRAGTSLQVLDCAYVPLRLDGQGFDAPPAAWQLWTPNKALGLTGVRAAYAIAPAQERPERIEALQRLAPSWPVGAHGVAMLSAWTQPTVQQWLQGSLATLRAWKSAQQALCTGLGWRVLPGSLANYFVAQLPGDATAHPTPAAALLHALRAHGIKLRDCSSFGLPGHVRLGVLAPEAQQALARAVGEAPGAQPAAATMPGPSHP